MHERTIASLCQRSHELSRSKGWYNGEEKDPRSIQLITLLMQSELIEALEEWRDNKKPDEIYFTMAGHTFSAAERARSVEPPGNDDAFWKPEGILIELADCIIRIAQRCGSDETPLEDIINIAVLPQHVTFTNDFETMLATAMADLSVSYLATTPGGKQMLEAHCMPDKPELFWAVVCAGIFSWADQNRLDLWSAIELKEAFNATRPMRHGGKKA